MSQYIIHDRESAAGSSRHGLMVIPPLIITTIFCFSFVMMHPDQAMRTTAASNQATPDTTDTQTELQPLTFASPNDLPILDNSSSTPPGDSSVNQLTEMPQSPTDSMASLQAAGPNSDSSSLIITVPKAPSVTTHNKPATSKTASRNHTKK